jgi:TolB protein
VFGGLTNVSNNAEPDQMPAWSPNGQRIAFVSDRAGYQDIFVASANGTNVRQITPADPSPAVSSEWWPAWSPDGGTIAYSSTYEGSFDIWTRSVDVTSAAPMLLTSGPDADYHPTWSPDGTRIAFHRIDANTGDANIVILTLSTGTLQVIQMAGQQLWPAWSPQGDLIAFSSNHEAPGVFQLYTMNADGTNVVRRSTDALNDLRPAWIKRQ